MESAVNLLPGKRSAFRVGRLGTGTGTAPTEVEAKTHSTQALREREKS